MSPTSKPPSPIGRLISEHLATLRPDLRAPIPVLADPAHWAQAVFVSPNLHAVSHLFACSWLAGALSLSAQPARPTAVSAGTRNTDARDEARSPEAYRRSVRKEMHHDATPITAEDSLYKSSGHYRSSRPTSTISGVVPSQGPAGTYQATCTDCTYNLWAGDQLCCQCKDINGHYHYTCTPGAYAWKLQPCNPFVGCPDIANCNGQLTRTYSYLGCPI